MGNQKKNTMINPYQQYSIKELKQMYANAKETSSYFGNYRGQMNEQFMLQYQLELFSRGVTLNEKKLPEGILNGKGAY